MATPATRSNLKEYALRALGKPVIEINADDDQLEDRIDEALQYFAQYHYDGIKRAYLKYQLTQADYDRTTTINSISETGTDNANGGVTTTWYEDKNYIENYIKNYSYKNISKVKVVLLFLYSSKKIKRIDF